MATNRNWFKRLFRLDFDDQFDAALDLIEIQEIAIVDVHDRVDGVQEAVKVVTGRVETVEGKLAALKTFDFFGRTVIAQFDFEKNIVGDTSITVSIDNAAAQAFIRFGSAKVVDTIDAVWFISKTGNRIINDFGDVLHPAAQRRDVQDFLYMTSEKQGDTPLDIIIPEHKHDNYAELDHTHPEYEGNGSDVDKAYVDKQDAAEAQAREDADDALQAQIDDLPAGTIVSDTAPEDPEEGATWYDTVRLELFVFAEDAWLPCSPLGARVEAGEILQAQILSRVEAGEVKQQTLSDTKLGKAEANEVANSFRIKGTGGTYISAAGGELGLYHVKYPESEGHAANAGYVDDETAKTKQYVDEEIAKVNGASSGPTSRYDGNRFSVSGTSTKSLSSGDVMFLSGEASTTTMAAVTGIALPESEFDWDSCAKSGVVKVKNGSRIAGYFQVYDLEKNEGRNVILNVVLLQLGTHPSIDYESGTPCYFQGVFYA